MIATTTRLNKPGALLAQLDGVHALTDVTGFGLAGHALEMARGAGLRAQLSWSAVPLVAGVAEFAQRGIVTGASGRNWAGYGADVRLAPGLPAVETAAPSWVTAETPTATAPSNSVAGVMVRPARSAVECAVSVKLPS